MSNTAADMSKESRAALRAALKDQLAVVRKKVRTMRAKNLMGISEPEEGDKDHDNSRMANRKSDRRLDHDHRESDRASFERENPGEEKNGNLNAELKSEALQFFQKGNRPKVGKTKSVVAKIMTSEQQSFARDSSPRAKGGKRK